MLSSSCLMAVVLAAAIRTAPQKIVDIAVTDPVLVPDSRSLESVCPTKLRIHACTVFTSALTTQCAPSRDAWSLHARANVEAVIYLWNPRSHPHELLHIRDIRGWLEEYVSAINRIPFATRERCDTYAERARGNFPAQMNELKLRTFRKRDRVAALQFPGR